MVTLLAITLFATQTDLDHPVKKALAPQPDYTLLQQELTDYLQDQPGVYGLYFIDLTSGKSFGYNETKSFHAASTFKLPMNLYLYGQAVNGNLNLEERLTNQASHAEGGTGLIKNHQIGGSYTIRQLASYSIIHSDNIATNILLEKLEREKVKDYMRSLGGKVVDNQQNTTCSYDLAIYMRKTINFARSSDPLAQLLLNDLYNSKYKERIPAPLPEDVKVANKIGTWPPTTTYNDVAYIAHTDYPYILAVTSKNTPDYGAAVAVIQHISKTIFDYQESVRG